MKVLSQNVRAYITAVVVVLSSPQKVHCLVYLAGLIWLIKFRSIQTISGVFGRKDTDGLHHFIRHSTNRPPQMAKMPLKTSWPRKFKARISGLSSTIQHVPEMERRLKALGGITAVTG